MNRAARFMALAGVSAGLVFSMCGCRGPGVAPQNSTQQLRFKLRPYVAMATAEHPIAMPDADKEDAIVVTVLRDGAVFLGSNRIDIGSLSQRVRDSLTNKVGKEAYIRADARANFRAVEDMIDLLRAAGVEGAGLLVGRKNADTQQNDPRFQEFSAGLELVVLPPPMLKHYFPKGIPESIDQVQILDGSGGIPAYKINQTAVQKAELLPKLTEMYKDRGERTLFIRADDDLDFASVVEVIDIAKGADVDHVAVLTPQMAASH